MITFLLKIYFLFRKKFNTRKMIASLQIKGMEGREGSTIHFISLDQTLFTIFPHILFDCIDAFFYSRQEYFQIDQTKSGLVVLLLKEIFFLFFYDKNFPLLSYLRKPFFCCFQKTNRAQKKLDARYIQRQFITNQLAKIFVDDFCSPSLFSIFFCCV